MPGALEKFQFWTRDVRVLTITPTEMNYLLVTFKTSLFISILYGLDVYFRDLWQTSDPEVVMFLTTKSDKEAVESNENWWRWRVINSRRDPLRIKWLVKPEEKGLRAKLECRVIISQVQSASHSPTVSALFWLEIWSKLLEVGSDAILKSWEVQKDPDFCFQGTSSNKAHNSPAKGTKGSFLGLYKIKNKCKYKKTCLLVAFAVSNEVWVFKHSMSLNSDMEPISLWRLTT